MKRKILFFIFVVVVLSSCDGKSKLSEVTLPTETIELTVSHFEKELFNADKYKLKELNKSWIEK